MIYKLYNTNLYKLYKLYNTNLFKLNNTKD